LQNVSSYILLQKTKACFCHTTCEEGANRDSLNQSEAEADKKWSVTSLMVVFNVKP
jgi:hypothetical protein